MIAAAHEDLAVLADEGVFRHDLYYRLVRDGVLVIPPLRERPEDVAVLALHYVPLAWRGAVRVDPAALARLADYHWPGNVRQLQTVLRVALRVDAGVLSAAAVDEALARFTRHAHPDAATTVTAGAGCVVAESVGASPLAARVGVGSGGFHAITAQVQRRALLQAYQATAGNKTAAGVLLGFHLSPGEDAVPESPISEARRNLALRKFRYWCGRLGIADALEPRAAAASIPAAARAEPGASRPAASVVPDASLRGARYAAAADPLRQQAGYAEPDAASSLRGGS